MVTVCAEKSTRAEVTKGWKTQGGPDGKFTVMAETAMASPFAVLAHRRANCSFTCLRPISCRDFDGHGRRNIKPSSHRLLSLSSRRHS
jgi:hypothetical protein